jgi:hypothetical protein
MRDHWEEQRGIQRNLIDPSVLALSSISFKSLKLHLVLISFPPLLPITPLIGRHLAKTGGGKRENLNQKVCFFWEICEATREAQSGKPGSSLN